MGFIRNVGKLAGAVAGVAIGAPINLAGEIVNSNFLKDIGKGVYTMSEHTGELLGNVAEGVSETVYGTVKSDSYMQSRGFEKVVESGASYVSGVAKGISKMATNGMETVDAILVGDTDRAIEVGKEIIKTVAVGTLAVGVADVIDNLDVFDDDVTIVDNPNIHHVTPHERVLSDGRTIWVDGDGDTSVDTYGGWYQSNPDYKV